LLIKTVFAGFGGQGVLLMGYVLAYSAMLEGKHVTYLPSYGAEMRGGTANCVVSVSDEEIASPVASSPDVAVIMNNPSLEKFQNQIQSGGAIYVNSDLINFCPLRGDVVLYEIPANTLALNLGNDRAANMVMLGAFLKKTPLVSLATAQEVVGRVFSGKPDLVDLNRKALVAGYESIGGE
jgi:2-oxoglutarate ferredoxin oxidoreductase subunit gamma